MGMNLLASAVHTIFIQKEVVKEMAEYLFSFYEETLFAQ
jgi:hypothetical protein